MSFKIKRQRVALAKTPNDDKGSCNLTGIGAKFRAAYLVCVFYETRKITRDGKIGASKHNELVVEG